MSERGVALDPSARPVWMSDEVLTAVRAMGLLFAAPFLLGILGGSIVAAAAGIALSVLARVALLGTVRTLLLPALVAYFGAVAVGAARWETLNLGLVRGAQAVLGPTIVVAPPAAAAAAIVAWAGGTVALGLWLGAPRSQRVELWSADAVAGALLLVTVFAGPALPGLTDPATLALAPLWILLTALTGAAAGGIGAWIEGRGRSLRIGFLAGATLAVASAGVLLALGL